MIVNQVCCDGDKLASDPLLVKNDVSSHLPIHIDHTLIHKLDIFMSFHLLYLTNTVPVRFLYT